MIRRALLLGLVAAAVSAAPAHASTWCGAENSTNLPRMPYGGSNVHVLYAYPSDGADRFAQFANAIETDAEHIDAWWRGQDPTRTVRFDLYPFACGPQLDLTSLQLPAPGASLVDTTALFGAIGAAATGSVEDSHSWVLAYYDGPSDQRYCGVGGGSPTGGIAVVFIDSCSIVYSERTAARELGDSLGGVPVGAPHRCPDRAAICGDASDVMNQYLARGPLSGVSLDPGRDDYYDHPGGWYDFRDAPFLRHLDSQQPLGLTIQGAGEVRSEQPGLDCTASCTTQWDRGTSVVLRATPGHGLRFVRWSGACRGAAVCRLTLDTARGVTALFAPATYRLAVSVAGRGRVVSRPAGISCGRSCRHAFTSYRPVRLTAKPARGWRLRAWSGACRGAGAACAVPMTRAAAVGAAFVRKR